MTIDRHHYKYGTMAHTHSIFETYVFLQWFFSKKHPCAEKRPPVLFSFFIKKVFVFVSRRLLKKRKKGSSALDLIITSALSIEEQQHTFFSSPLLVFPRRRHIPFLLKITNLSLCVVRSLVVRSVLPLVVN